MQSLEKRKADRKNRAEDAIKEADKVAEAIVASANEGKSANKKSASK